MSSGRGWFYESGTAGTFSVDVPEGSWVVEISAVGDAPGEGGPSRLYVEVILGGESTTLPDVVMAEGEPFWTFPEGLQGPCVVTFVDVQRYFCSWKGA